MSNQSLNQKANQFLALHRSGKMLVLPNIWDPIGARILAARGYPAVATASAAVSAALGYRDGEMLTRKTMIEMIGRIARSVDVPVTADMESGYGESLSELEMTTHQVLEAGVVGLNIQDSMEQEPLRSVEEQCKRISTVRETANRRGVHLVINARVDSFISSQSKGGTHTVDEATTRAKAYAAAGADCIYPIGPGDEETVKVIRDRIEAPINILASPTAAPLPKLQAIGVNRISFGPFVFRSCIRKFVEIVEGLRVSGDYAGLKGSMAAGEITEYLIEGHE